MSERFAAPRKTLTETLIETWAAQAREGFLLADPENVDLLVSAAADPRCGVTYRFRWMPHREIRGDVSGSSQLLVFSYRRHDLDRRLRRDAVAVAPDIAIENAVADDGDARGT